MQNKIKNTIKAWFTTIPTKLIQDSTINRNSRMLFVYMASHNENFDFYHEPAAKNLGITPETLAKYIKELILTGWITREERRLGGKFQGYDYSLHPEPVDKITVPGKNGYGKKPSRFISDLISNNGEINNNILSIISSNDFVEILAQNGFKSDSPEERLRIYKYYEKFILESEVLKNTLHFHAKGEKYNKEEVLKTWVSRASWEEVIGCKLNKLGNWIKSNNFKVSKTVENDKGKKGGLESYRDYYQ